MNKHALILILVCSFMSFAKTYESEGQKFTLEILMQQQDVIWGFDFLPNNQIIFTERSGRMRIFDPASKVISEVKGVPKVWAQGQGGLLDVRVQPKKAGIFIYWTYSEPKGELAATTLAVAKLEGKELKETKRLFTSHEASDEKIHFGSRIEFATDGKLIVTSGERNARSHALELGFHTGKTIRINEDGSAPEDNPFVSNPSAKPEIWTRGHRSPQGLARHPETGELFLAEMGPRGGDEVNLLKKGANYGWPEVTYGREYWGPSIGVKQKPGVEEPIIYWVPSISPSAIAFYSGSKFPKWKNNLFVACLSGEQLRRLVLSGTRVVKQEELLSAEGFRFRNVRTGPDGYLYVSTDNGIIARLISKN